MSDRNYPAYSKGFYEEIKKEFETEESSSKKLIKQIKEIKKYLTKIEEILENMEV